MLDLTLVSESSRLKWFSIL